MATQNTLLKSFRLQNLKIWQRLGLGFGAVVFLLVAETIATDVMERRIETEVEEIYSENIEKTELLEKMSEQTHIVSRRLRTVLLLRGADGTDEQLKGIEQARAEYDTASEELQKTPASEEEKNLRAKIDAAKNVARRENGKVLELAARGQYDQAFLQVLAARDEVERWQEALDENVLLQQKQNAESFETIKDDFKYAETMTLVFGGVAAFIAVLVAWWNARTITAPVRELQTTVEKVKGGDTQALANITRRDEMGDLGRTVNALLQDRIEAQQKAERANEALNDSIIDLMRAVAKLSRGDLTTHAPVREDVTGALGDAINSMSDATAKTLAGVTHMSYEVRSASREGRDTVLLTSKGMNDIRGTIQETGKRIKRLGERSQEITGIVKLIDDIAERTSVLALNANMQAAMAGEAGRGFRVVADEVQRLAERSKEATEQIGKLVNTIQAETNDTMVTMDRAIGEVVKGGELADKAANKVTELDELGGRLLESVQSFTLPAELISGNDASTGRRAA